MKTMGSSVDVMYSRVLVCTDSALHARANDGAFRKDDQTRKEKD